MLILLDRKVLRTKLQVADLGKGGVKLEGSPGNGTRELPKGLVITLIVILLST